MIRLASVIARFESAFLDQYRDRLRPEHTHALAAMKHCRSQASPKMLAACTACEHQRLVPHSCGHRHCPHCQHHESQQWIERLEADRFVWPRDQAAVIELDVVQLHWLLAGVDLEALRGHPMLAYRRAV